MEAPWLGYFILSAVLNAVFLWGVLMRAWNVHLDRERIKNRPAQHMEGELWQLWATAQAQAHIYQNIPLPTHQGDIDDVIWGIVTRDLEATRNHLMMLSALESAR